MAVQWGSSEQAFKALWDAMQQLAAVPLNKKITKLAFTWTAGLSVETIEFYDGVELLFTLTFTWNGDATLKEIVRT
jgi:hypothetical protein